MSNEMFPRFLPIDIKFMPGESPSPQKLTSIFKYLYSAFYVLESFLGNGLDYRPESIDSRKMIFNISNSLGSMGKLNKPTNKLCSLTSIYRDFILSDSVLLLDGISTDRLHDEHAILTGISDPYAHAAGDAEKSLKVNQAFNIPVDKHLSGAWAFGIETNGFGGVTIYYESNIKESITITNGFASTHNSITITDRYVSHISITTDTIYPLEIFSIYLVNKADTLMDSAKPYNIAYALDLSNPTYFEVNKPCMFAEQCPLSNGSYCIGNTYDLYVHESGVSPAGRPICGGLYSSSVIDPSLIPGGFAYQPNTSSQIYTIQSPLLMLEKQYMVKFAPYAVHNLASSQTIVKNVSMVYDIEAGAGTSNPIKYNMPIQSAGRPDMVFVNDTSQELNPSNNRIIIIGGTYGITNMLNDVIETITEMQPRSVSVYAD